MRVQICAVGRLRAGPERELVEDYLTRFDRTGRGLGLGPSSLVEVEDKKNTGPEAEAALLKKQIPHDAVICTLDERGKLLSSPEFSNLLAGWRDAGRAHVSFIIGGADGIAPSLRSEADYSLSFGKMVWPHMLARVMLCEQLYRAASIAARLPYHRT
ncbi:MAG: 23S rRNA (pseudouridine(1915)-N(3))-methyltransferase RlmH [Paracoccaceae bacterium]